MIMHEYKMGTDVGKCARTGIRNKTPGTIAGYAYPLKTRE